MAGTELRGAGRPAPAAEGERGLIREPFHCLRSALRPNDRMRHSGRDRACTPGYPCLPRAKSVYSTIKPAEGIPTLYHLVNLAEGRVDGHNHDQQSLFSLHSCAIIVSPAMMGAGKCIPPTDNAMNDLASYRLYSPRVAHPVTPSRSPDQCGRISEGERR